MRHESEAPCRPLALQIKGTRGSLNFGSFETSPFITWSHTRALSRREETNIAAAVLEGLQALQVSAASTEIDGTMSVSNFIVRILRQDVSSQLPSSLRALTPQPKHSNWNFYHSLHS